MLYIVHNFFQEFLAAVKANDTILLTDLITDEISKIIVFDRGKIIEIIKKAKTQQKLSSRPTDAEIIQILINEIKTNEILNNYITDLIISNNTDKSNGTETVPPYKRKEFVKKALSMFINNDNDMLLKKKTASHLKVRDMNFAADAEVIDLTKKQKRVIVIKTILFTTTILTAGFFTVKALIKKGVFKKKNSETDNKQNNE